MEVSAVDVNGIGVDRVEDSWQREVITKNRLCVRLTADFLLLSRPVKTSRPGSDAISVLAAFIDRRSISNFSFSAFCFSSSKFVVSSLSWVDCSAISSSPYSI